MKYIKIVLVSFFSIFTSLQSSAQIVKTMGKEVAKESVEVVAKKAAQKVAKEAVEKVAKEQVQKYSTIFVKESGEELVEKSTRILIKEGVESGLEGTVKKSARSIGNIYTCVFVKTTSKVIGETASVGAKEAAETTTKKGFKFSSIYLGKKLKETAIQKELNEMMAKGPINLSPKEIKYLRENMDYANLKTFIKKYTGDKKNFIEFFIRLSKSNPKLAKEILNDPTIRKKINSAIRNSSGGGVHEWLMTKNFEDFLLNPKWGDDGSFLAVALVKFVQKTSSVVYKKGGNHFSGTLFSKQFHDGLSRIIENCSSKEELFIAIKRYAKTTLTKESYDEFIQIFTSIFNANKLLI